MVAASEAGFDLRLVHLVGLVVEGSKRMLALVNDLLDLPRPEQGRTTLQMEAQDLREVVRGSIESTRPLFQARAQPLTVHLPETNVSCGAIGAGWNRCSSTYSPTRASARRRVGLWKCGSRGPGGMPRDRPR